MIDGFKKFIARGNMIDMAVGVVMGSAVTSAVNAIVNSLINPLIAMIFGKPNMDGLLAFTFNGATVSIGAVFGAVLNFFIIAVAVYFFILVPINKFRDMSDALLVKAKLKAAADAAEAASKEAVGKGTADVASKETVAADSSSSTVDDKSTPTAEEQTVALLTEIRDELVKRRTLPKSV
ncbi:large conductance mechanosensitive channel protein MscL [Bifidobacterium hapali]|uniref:Large-conductance mechanosensitive channel n=1 Tax=Bifidobacterium hapali TaxID=1630172 RepID=A0A261FVN8_9BIFI|nr:large conductance mechanosensitive channel protein MscL [Bifidobacterium hapali]